MDWSKVIKEYRGKHGVSIRAFAKILGANPKTVFYWEAGIYKPSFLMEYKLRQLMEDKNG